MERYENLGLVGEGSYGIVMKCRHKESNQIVAIKKFIESEEDRMVKKIAMREIRMLKQLRHENLVNLLEVFRRKKHLYLVFEFVDHTVLDELERRPDGLHTLHVKKISFQVLRGLEFCHGHNIIHRDVKPENILISKSGIVKLCDFGFARTLATGPGEEFTDYVATRWYRAPELLVGDINYGKAVDIWAVGCLLFEMITGDPLFPGDSDIDQLFHITKHLGNLTQRHIEIFHKNTLFTGMRLPNVRNPELLKTYKQLSPVSRDLIILSLALDASERPTCLEMMKHKYYSEGEFSNTFLENLKLQIEREIVLNPLLKSLASQKDEYGDNYANKERKKDRKQHEHRESLTKTSQETKKKKEHKMLSQQNSNPHVSNQSYLLDHEQHKKTARTGATDDSSSTKDTGTINNSNCYNSSDDKLSSPSEVNSKLNDHERSDTKCSSRTTLDISINIPGKNLPDINRVTNGGRAHGHDILKSKKNFSKKMHKHSDGILCPVAEKAPLYLDRKSQDDINEKMKKKESKKDFLELDAVKKSSLHLPSVKAKSTKTSPSRGGGRKQYGTTIPHIQNIDLFSSGSNTTRESPTGRTQRDGNLPAV